jgi:hypothetical protein
MKATITFPFGRRAVEGEKLALLIDKKHGVLYVGSDGFMMYGGKTKSKYPGENHRTTDHNDTLASYKLAHPNHDIKIIPLA